MFKSIISFKRVKIGRRLALLFLGGMICVFFISGCNSEESETYADYTENYKTEDIFTKKFYGSVSIAITNVQEDTSSGTVDVVIPDLKKIYLEHRDELQENLTEDHIRKILTENLHQFVIEESFVSELYQDGTTWKMASTEQIDSLVADVVDDYLGAVLADTELTDITIDISTEGM